MPARLQRHGASDIRKYLLKAGGQSVVCQVAQLRVSSLHYVKQVMLRNPISAIQRREILDRVDTIGNSKTGIAELLLKLCRGIDSTAQDAWLDEPAV